MRLEVARRAPYNISMLSLPRQQDVFFIQLRCMLDSFASNYIDNYKDEKESLN
jgi:hypothetical protein